jgi:hypothetical protein
MKKKGLASLSFELEDGTSGHWLGDSTAEKVMV